MGGGGERPVFPSKEQSFKSRPSTSLARLNTPANTDHEDELGLSGHVEAAVLLGNAVEADLVGLLAAVLLGVLLSALERLRALDLAVLLGLGSGGNLGLGERLIALALLEDCLRNPKVCGEQKRAKEGGGMKTRLGRRSDEWASSGPWRRDCAFFLGRKRGASRARVPQWDCVRPRAA